MIDFLWHLLLGIGIGAYFFNSNVRSGVNDIIKRIAVGLYSMLNDHYNGKKSRPTRQTTSAPRVAMQQSNTVKSLRTTAQDETGGHFKNVKGLYLCTCGGILEPVKDWPNYYACEKCHSLKALSKV